MPAITQDLIVVNELLLGPWNIVVTFDLQFHLTNQQSAQLLFILKLKREEFSTQTLYVQFYSVATCAHYLRVGRWLEIFWKSG